jgi:ACR3 family arsenite efflux pump ArsB
MMGAASRQRSVVLILLFTGWVLSPFLALALANLRARTWPPHAIAPGAILGVTFIRRRVAMIAMVPEM